MPPPQSVQAPGEIPDERLLAGEAAHLRALRADSAVTVWRVDRDRQILAATEKKRGRRVVPPFFTRNVKGAPGGASTGQPAPTGVPLSEPAAVPAPPPMVCPLSHVAPACREPEEATRCPAEKASDGSRVHSPKFVVEGKSLAHVDAQGEVRACSVDAIATAARPQGAS